jgi:hypothetical protein
MAQSGARAWPSFRLIEIEIEIEIRKRLPYSIKGVV